jgi:hypothetical protein
MARAPLWGAILAPAFKRGLAKIGSSEPIFDWGSSLFSIFTPPGPAGHPPHKCGGQGVVYPCKQQLTIRKELFMRTRIFGKMLNSEV